MTDMEVIRRLAEATMHPETRPLTDEEEMAIEEHLPARCRFSERTRPFRLSARWCYTAFVEYLREKLPDA